MIKQHPFKIDEIVILPEHIHVIWTLPENNAYFLNRWRLIKSYFSRKFDIYYQITRTLYRQQKKGLKSNFCKLFLRHKIKKY